MTMNKVVTADSRAHSALRSQPEHRPGGLDPDRIALLAAASLAPSSHNTQPWLVWVSDSNRWTIGQDPNRALHVVDPGNREPVIAIGAFLENLVEAAGSVGLHVALEVLARELTDRELVRVELSPARRRDGMSGAIPRRRTIKNGYRTRELTRADLALLTAGMNGSVAYFPYGSAQASYLADGTIEAFRHQSSRDDAQRELARWIRFSSADARQHLDGLTPATMEITGMAGLFVRSFFTADTVMKESFRARGVDSVATQARAHGGWLVLTAPDESIQAHLDVGRRLQRLALRACERSIGLHPMSQLIQEAPWRREIAADLGLDTQVRLIVRVGYVERYPEPVSLRRPVSSFTMPA
jgi:hypothetical protein